MRLPLLARRTAGEVMRAPLRIPPLNATAPWFLARVTAVLAAPARYECEEVWLFQRAVALKPGGIRITDLSAGYSVTGAALAVGDVVLARAAPGDAGLTFELWPAGGAGSASLTDGESVLTTDLAVLAGSGWNVALALALPAAGTYRLFATVTGTLPVPAAGVGYSLAGSVFNGAAAQVSGTTFFAVAATGATGAAGTAVGTGSFSKRYTAAAAEVLTLRATVGATSGAPTATVRGESSGFLTCFGHLKVG